MFLGSGLGACFWAGCLSLGSGFLIRVNLRNLWMIILKRLDPGSATPKGTPSARDDTVNSLVVVYFWLGVHHFTNVFPNPYPADPVDPVIRVKS